MLKLIRLFRLFKLLRLTRLKYVILALQKKFPKSIYFTTFIELFLYFFLFAHWTGCIFFSIAYGMADPHGNEHEQYLFLNGWVYLDGLLGKLNAKPKPQSDSSSTAGCTSTACSVWPKARARQLCICASRPAAYPLAVLSTLSRFAPMPASVLESGWKWRLEMADNGWCNAWLCDC